MSVAGAIFNCMSWASSLSCLRSGSVDDLKDRDTDGPEIPKKGKPPRVHRKCSQKPGEIRSFNVDSYHVNIGDYQHAVAAQRQFSVFEYLSWCYIACEGKGSLNLKDE